MSLVSHKVRNNSAITYNNYDWKVESYQQKLHQNVPPNKIDSEKSEIIKKSDRKGQTSALGDIKHNNVKEGKNSTKSKFVWASQMRSQFLVIYVELQ